LSDAIAASASRAKAFPNLVVTGHRRECESSVSQNVDGQHATTLLTLRYLYVLPAGNAQSRKVLQSRKVPMAPMELFGMPAEC